MKETAPDFSTPPASSAYEYRGMVYADKGEYELAIKDFETTLSMNPNHETAKKELLEVKTMLASSERLCDNLGEGYKVFMEFLEKEKQERENSDFPADDWEDKADGRNSHGAKPWPKC